MKKPNKKIKLENKAKIRRRLFRLWSQKVLESNGNICAVTGAKRGNIVNGKPVILDAHHLFDKWLFPALRYDVLGGIALCKSAHKFGLGAHKSPLWFALWMQEHRPKQFAYAMSHYNDPIDLDNRDVLYAIEAKLKSASLTSEELDILGIAKCSPE